jgi:hypothetical protein
VAVATKPFRPATGPYTASAVLAELARLWDRASHRMEGKQRLTQTQLAQESGVPKQTLSSWATGTALPRDAAQVEKAGTVLARRAGEPPPPLHEWERWLEADQAARPDHAPVEAGPGRLISELDDPFALEVHRPVKVDSGDRELPLLPPYVRRGHDEELAAVVAEAAGGRSAMTVLVGGSSTGKTRACWEAVHQLPAGWRLWHPFDPTHPEALLAELPRVGPRTVVWLNETQFYLYTPGDIGERVAAALRTLVTDPARAPVLVLGTLWPEYWDSLTRSGGEHAQARAVLDGTPITVHPMFTGPALAELHLAAAADPRLAAAANAPDGQVTQYLAGVPALLDRYCNAPPAAKALIHAAMDARRLGHSMALPHGLLEAAAPAYLTDAEWNALGENWLAQALAHTAAPCRGVSGPLTRIRSRSGKGLPGTGSGFAADGPAYRLADYLDQYGRRHRAELISPNGFWAAAIDHARAADQDSLSDAARSCGLYRAAAQLCKNAVAANGDPDAAARLVKWMHDLTPADNNAARWVSARASVDNPSTVAVLLNSLRQAGAEQQLTTLATRAATSASLDNPRAVAFLLNSLRWAGAEQQLTMLLSRNPATSASLGKPSAVAFLLDSLRKAGAEQQVITLLSRAATSAPLGNPNDVAFLLDSLRQAGAQQQVITLATRAATNAPLGNPNDVAFLLDSLRHPSTQQQVITLATRAATNAPLDSPRAVTVLLDSLRHPGTEEQLIALATRAATSAPLDDPSAVAVLLTWLRQAGAEQLVIMLATRAATSASLDNPYTVASLLDSLRHPGTQQQVITLATRAATNASLENPSAVAHLLDSLRKAGAEQQVITLLSRDPATSASLDNPSAVAVLLTRLWQAGADQQVITLLSRAATSAPLDNPNDVAGLLTWLRHAGTEQQVITLATRAATNASLDNPYAVAVLLDSLRKAGTQQQVITLANRAASSAFLEHPPAVARLLDSLREAGADEQVAKLRARLPSAGMFDLFLKEEAAPEFRFGREPDGKPAEPWGWDELS